MDFFGDFCLSCDRQTDGATFCSQACRLAELDHYTSSEPASPFYCNTTAIQRAVAPVTFGLYLPPPFDFSLYRVPSATSISTAKSKRSSITRLSEQARHDLNEYVESFDQIRTLKRRASLQSNDERKSSTAS